MKLIVTIVFALATATAARSEAQSEIGGLYTVNQAASSVGW